MHTPGPQILNCLTSPLELLSLNVALLLTAWRTTGTKVGMQVLLSFPAGTIATISVPKFLLAGAFIFVIPK
jgi:hypothetical protein